MNSVYIKRIFYFQRIKKIIINVVLFLILFELYSCSLHKIYNELTIKVTKAGSINPSAKFVFICPNVTSLPLRYKSILNKIAEKLSYYSFYEVKDIKQAKYAFIVRLDNTFYNYLYNEESDNNPKNVVLNYNKWLKQNFTKEVFKKQNNFLLEVYLVDGENNYTKVMEGYTIKTNENITTSQSYDKSYLDFVMCSIDALFDEAVNLNNSNYQEYYYKCY